MASRLSTSEQFLVLFNRLKDASGGNPERVRIFYNQSEAIRDALRALNAFLAETDLERRLSLGPKLVRITASDFHAAWTEYTRNWRFQVSAPSDVAEELISYALGLERADPAREAELAERAWKEAVVQSVDEAFRPLAQLRTPDPENEETFDPLVHDGGAAIDLGIECLETFSFPDLEEGWDNRRTIALGAHDYLANTIGLNLYDIFRHWRQIPFVLMPAHVSNRYGVSDKGSLPQLLNDAIRAYVCGAPAASFAMCRAAFEMILKRHYGDGKWEDPREKLAKVVALANERGIIKREEIRPLIDRADGILHRYAQEAALTPEDERTILIFLTTLKSLIERAPKPSTAELAPLPHCGRGWPQRSGGRVRVFAAQFSRN